MKGTIAVLLLLVASLTLFAQSDYQTVVCNGTYITIMMVFRTAADGQTLEMNLSAVHSGWIGIAFGNNDGMNGHNFIIGYCSETIPYARDDYGTGNWTHASDTSLGGTDNISFYGGGDMGGNVSMNFHIPLNSGDQYDTLLVPNEYYNVILCVGNSHDFTSAVYDYGYVNIQILSATPNVDQLGNAPALLKMLANYPNPFNPATTLHWQQARSSATSISVYNMRGGLVFRREIDNPLEGENSFVWKGLNNQGEVQPSGVYYTRISSGGKSVTGKILMQK